MNSYSALPEDLCFPNDENECIQVTVDSVTEKLRQIDKSKASGPDNLPSWLLKTYADILAPTITDVLNSSFLEGEVPSMWKIANIAPLPKAQDIEDFNKDLRPIALTSTLSKIAEEYIRTMGGQKKVAPHYNTVVVYKRQKVPKQFRNIHGAVQINSK